MFICRECGNEFPKWEGRCSFCGAWDSLRQFQMDKPQKQSVRTRRPHAEACKLTDIDARGIQKTSTTIKELDVVLGGGIAPGAVVLIGGEPGVGKSTLMMQMLERISNDGTNTLYVSGEESLSQLKIRAERLGIAGDSLYILNHPELTQALAIANETNASVLVVDSIQSVYNGEIDGAAGSTQQLRGCTSALIDFAKQNNKAVFIVGHITKAGLVAGPKILEHMVDTVLYFEGDLNRRYKILRAVKNRFGSTQEIGIFEMRVDGLREVGNPSVLFSGDNESGGAISCIIEGTRPFLVELQSLVTDATYGTPQRVVIGYDSKKLAVMLAIIENHLGLSLRQSDVFAGLSGGITTKDPAVDLALAASLITSASGTEPEKQTLFIGEIGLNGDIRPVADMERRISEAKRLGYKKIVVSGQKKSDDPTIVTVARINDLYRLLKGK
ncbi:MAG: DNA repair protein RadA [Candidatus Cloacimonetes bacterium]|nr:DNA repair protein RadA [Candidatus Cloacimonadota bacterium]